MAPSQDLRYEWSKLYRARMERIRVVGGIIFVPFVLAFIGAVLWFPRPRPEQHATALGLLFGGFALTALAVFLLVRFDRREERRFKTFLTRAKAHGGWWFLRGRGDIRSAIVYADELRPDVGMVCLMEPLDLLGCDEHQEIIRAEIRRFHKLADGSRQVAVQYLRQAQCFEGLLQPDLE